MSLNYSFAGRRILITGGGQGIGRQLVQRFHDGGAKVYTLDKNLENTVKLRKELPTVTSEIVDLSDWQETRKLIESFGPVDHLVNNAAILMPQNILEITEDVATLQYSVNVNAVINVTQVVARGMIENGLQGTIVNISSMIASRCIPNTASYGASKAALETLTKSMALELGSNNIRVNCLVPGLTNAPMSHLPSEIENFAAILDKLVIKRQIETNEVADLVMFLLSPLSSMVVGQAIVLDGGWMLT